MSRGGGRVPHVRLFPFRHGERGGGALRSLAAPSPIQRPMDCDTVSHMEGNELTAAELHFAAIGTQTSPPENLNTDTLNTFINSSAFGDGEGGDLDPIAIAVGVAIGVKAMLNRDNDEGEIVI